MTLAAGLIIGRIPTSVPGGFRMSAAQSDQFCRSAAQWTHGQAGHTPLCQHAQTVMVLAGFLIVAGCAS
jgi:hypothetical protein